MVNLTDYFNCHNDYIAVMQSDYGLVLTDRITAWLVDYMPKDLRDFAAKLDPNHFYSATNTGRVKVLGDLSSPNVTQLFEPHMHADVILKMTEIVGLDCIKYQPVTPKDAAGAEREFYLYGLPDGYLFAVNDYVTNQGNNTVAIVVECAEHSNGYRTVGVRVPMRLSPSDVERSRNRVSDAVADARRAYEERKNN